MILDEVRNANFVVVWVEFRLKRTKLKIEKNLQFKYRISAFFFQAQKYTPF